jgi:hypothetical protein
MKQFNNLPVQHAGVLFSLYFCPIVLNFDLSYWLQAKENGSG